MSTENLTPEEIEIDRIRKLRIGLIEALTEGESLPTDKDTVYMLAALMGQHDSTTLKLMKLKQDDESAIRADNIAIMGVEAIKQWNKAGQHPFVRNPDGSPVTVSSLPDDIQISSGLTETMKLTGNESFSEFDTRMSSDPNSKEKDK